MSYVVRQFPKLMLPVTAVARVSSAWGMQEAGVHAKPHSGTDFGVPEGTSVYAVDDGTVDASRVDDGGGGEYIKLVHPDGITTRYLHLSARYVNRGEQVQAGDEIGASGNTGSSTAPHLHFEVRDPSDTPGGIDPEPWIPGLFPVKADVAEYLGRPYYGNAQKTSMLVVGAVAFATFMLARKIKKGK